MCCGKGGNTLSHEGLANVDIPGGGGGTLIFSHIRRLCPFFGVQNFEFHYFFGFSEKMNIFWGNEYFMDIFLGSSQNWASLRVISMQFRVFF